MESNPTPPACGTSLRPLVARPTVAAAVFALAALLPRQAHADLLTGGLLDSVFRGEPFTGPRLVDLVVIGLVIFVVLRLILGRQKPDRQGGTATPSQDRYEPDQYRDDTPSGPAAPRPKPDMYSNAAATWAYLQSPQAKAAPGEASATPPAALGSDAEFLAGAKMAYPRIVAAMAKRDFDDLAHFVAPEYLAELRQSLPASPPPEPDILLVEAKLADKRQENGRTVMTVDFSILIHEQNAPHNVDRFELWRFRRDDAQPGAHWLLEARERRN